MFSKFEAGQVVFSKQGRDKGLAFIIISLDGEYAYLADGKVRPIEKPKKKKLKHLQPVNQVEYTLRNKIINNEYLTNADFYKSIEKFNKKPV